MSLRPTDERHTNRLLNPDDPNFVKKFDSLSENDRATVAARLIQDPSSVQQLMRAPGNMLAEIWRSIPEEIRHEIIEWRHKEHNPSGDVIKVNLDSSKDNDKTGTRPVRMGFFYGGAASSSHNGKASASSLDTPTSPLLSPVAYQSHIGQAFDRMVGRGNASSPQQSIAQAIIDDAKHYGGKLVDAVRPTIHALEKVPGLGSVVKGGVWVAKSGYNAARSVYHGARDAVDYAENRGISGMASDAKNYVTQKASATYDAAAQSGAAAVDYVKTRGVSGMASDAGSAIKSGFGSVRQSVSGWFSSPEPDTAHAKLAVASAPQATEQTIAPAASAKPQTVIATTPAPFDMTGYGGRGTHHRAAMPSDVPAPVASAPVPAAPKQTIAVQGIPNPRSTAQKLAFATP